MKCVVVCVFIPYSALSKKVAIVRKSTARLVERMSTPALVGEGPDVMPLFSSAVPSPRIASMMPELDSRPASVSLS